MAIMEITGSVTDGKGNRIEYEGDVPLSVRVVFRGRNNTIRIASGAKLAPNSILEFCGNDGEFSVAESSRPTPGAFGVRVGHRAKIVIGKDVSTTGQCFISSSEGATVSIGDDVMIAKNVQIRSDDAHPIYDADSGERLNPSKNIHIGNHVWLAYESMIMGGAWIGDGSVVGLRALVYGQFKENLVLVGVPAKPVKENVRWDRRSLSYFPVEDDMISLDYPTEFVGL